MAEFVIETYKVLELTKASEYLDLSDADKAWFNLIISTGKVDLSTGSLAQEKLWDMFGAETITGTAYRSVESGLVQPPPIEE